MPGTRDAETPDMRKLCFYDLVTVDPDGSAAMGDDV